MSNIIRGLSAIRSQDQKAVVAIGNFDGVHLGHQAVIEQLKQLAQRLATQTMVMTFEPHPKEYFQATPQARLTTWRHKVKALFALGVDHLICLPFTHHLANLSADAFMNDILMQKLAVSGIVVGDDFRFGAKRVGDSQLLQQFGQAKNIPIKIVPPFLHHQQRISSSQLRQLLQAGEVESLTELMQNPYTVRARVQRGDGRGREWGFPTANLPFQVSDFSLPFGIYVVDAQYGNNPPFPAVASVGVRPTVGRGLQPLLEVHLLDGDHELYDLPLTVRFLQRLREEKAFDSFDELILAIEQDCQQARAYFSI